MSGDRHALHLIAWGWLLLGALLLSLGALLLAGAWKFHVESIRTPGVVVAHVGRDGDEPAVAPVVEYRQPDGLRGRVIAFSSMDESSAPSVGTVLAVRYQQLPDGGVVARIDSTFEIWGVPLIVLLFGAVFLAAGVYARRVVATGSVPRRDRRRPTLDDWHQLQRDAVLRKQLRKRVPPLYDRGKGR